MPATGMTRDERDVRNAQRLGEALIRVVDLMPGCAENPGAFKGACESLGEALAASVLNRARRRDSLLEKAT